MASTLAAGLQGTAHQAKPSPVYLMLRTLSSCHASTKPLTLTLHTHRTLQSPAPSTTLCPYQVLIKTLTSILATWRSEAVGGGGLSVLVHLQWTLLWGNTEEGGGRGPGGGSPTNRAGCAHGATVGSTVASSTTSTGTGRDLQPAYLLLFDDFWLQHQTKGSPQFSAPSWPLLASVVLFLAVLT